MSHRYKIEDQRGLYYLTFTVVAWIDVFTRSRYCDLILESLKHCKEHKGLHIYGYVIMSNHLHLILSASGKQSLPMMKLLILISTFCLFSCSPLLNQIPKKQEIIVNVLNEKIEIPTSDELNCVDTIYIEIINNTKSEYLFDGFDNLMFYFQNLSPKDNDFIDPFDGISLGFIDENGNYLNSEGYSGFYPDGFENIVIKHEVNKLGAEQRIVIRVPLVFPSRLDYGSYIQKVPNIKSAKSVEIFFRPINGYLKNVLIAKGELRLEKDQRIMDFTRRFYLPVVFTCN